jgi:hypothetical protein
MDMGHLLGIPHSVTAKSQGEVLLRVFEVLDRAGVPYCVMNGYDGYPADLGTSDVDCIVPPAVLPHRLAALLYASRHYIGANPAQWLERVNHFITLAWQGPDRSPCFLDLDVHPGYHHGHYLFYAPDEVLQSRRRYREFWVPASDIEFGCYLVKKIAKGALNESQGEVLSELYGRDPAGCHRQVARFWGSKRTALLPSAAAGRRWEEVRDHLPGLRRELFRRAARRQPVVAARSRLAGLLRQLRQWWTLPNGLHVVLLGPDGVGKSTVLEAVCRDLTRLFNKAEVRTFAPALLDVLSQQPPVIARPHDKPPRSLPASLAKAAYWFAFYSVGYHVTVRLGLAHSAFWINHRYLVDALVDPRRYRYKGPRWLLRLIWRLAPKPDLIILLDAPAEVVQARKQEVPLEETRRQCAVYRALVQGMSNGRIVDATPPPEVVAAETNQTILQFLAARIARRFGVE